MAMDSSGDKISATSCLETDAIEKQKISPTPPAENSEDDEKMTGEKQGGLADAKWEDMFNRLVAYKKKHGDCLVPNRYPEDPQLGSWVSTQRRHYKMLTSGGEESTPLTPERAKRLVEMGFQWITRDPRHVPWEQRYAELVAFKKKYGHSQVPIGWEENIKLSNWVSTQRQEYKLIQKGRQSRLTLDRLEKLNQVDFVWEAQRGGPRRKRRAVVAVPPQANPVDISSRSMPSSVARGNSFYGWMGTAPQGAFVPATAGVTSEVQDNLSAQSPMNVSVSPWQMMPNGTFQQAFGIPPGMNPAFLPMATHWQMAAVPGFQYGMMFPAQGNLAMGTQSFLAPPGAAPDIAAMRPTNESNDKKEGTEDGKISDNSGR